MFRKAISLTLVFALTLALFPMPVKAQFSFDREFDPLGRITRISFVNPNSGVRETMTFAYGETFEAQTFSTEDGLLVFATSSFINGDTVSSLFTNGSKTLSVEAAVLKQDSGEAGTSPVKITASFENIRRSVTATEENSSSFGRLFDVFSPVAEASTKANFHSELGRLCDFVNQATLRSIPLPASAWLHAASANIGIGEDFLCEPEAVPAGCKTICQGACDKVGGGRKCRIACRVVCGIIAIVLCGETGGSLCPSII
jgi:hypothetical protein